MTTTVQTQEDVSAILSEVTSVQGVAGMAAWNPMETIPTLAIGEDIKPGTTLTGYFVRNETIASPKFVHSKTKNEYGVPTQIRHVFRSIKTGKLFGIWTCGELRMACDKLFEGEIGRAHV